MAMGCRFHMMNNGKAGCIGAFLIVLGICAACMVNPTNAAWFPKCLFKQLTGFDCPGCGTARAIHAAAHGDFSAAFHYNPILVVAIPFCVIILAKPDWAKRRCVAWSAFIVSVGWMILRNAL